MSEPARSTYGGQAVVEGVMMRGQHAMAIAVRRPDGEIQTRSDHLRGFRLGPLRRLPLLRGVIVLAETVVLGGQAITWSSAIAVGDMDEHGNPRGLGRLESLVIACSMMAVIGMFFVGPVLATFWLDGRAPLWTILAIEGAIRVVLLVGYIWFVGRSDDMRRIFQYHGAEHMTIAAYEDDRDLTVPAVRRYPKEHPRCGTSFLLSVALVSIVVFAFAGTEPLWWHFASRIVLVPLVAAVAYEAIRFAGFHQGWPLVNLLFAGNIALQALTTSPPDDEQIQVAIRAMDEVIAEERRG